MTARPHDGHICTSPDPSRCIYHVLDQAIEEQQAERVRQEVLRERHQEWEAE